ncbi:hypothetical protein IFM89_035814 [Coptis chinensis]|uniref:Disease resistance protein winged helix domain-containing protein n=1 Tax=Coptis chinensis TaxID=261450 RepID=A0A835M2M5_9MAGN|nr:hypothetical protein IFM89_035814 [Coptis chinensis]
MNQFFNMTTLKVKSVCDDNMHTHKNIRVEILSLDEACEFFASRTGSEVLTIEIHRPIAREMVYECGSIPIAIITLGHAMRHVDNKTAWRKALHDLRTPSLIQGMEIELLKILGFNYHHLKNCTVKSCFMYCAFSPDNYLFKPEELIRFWMAESLIQDEEDLLKEIDEGFNIIRELTDARMLEVLVESGEERLKMHDLFRELAISLLRSDLASWLKLDCA